MALTVKIKQATFGDDISTADLLHVALEYSDSETGKHGTIYIDRDGTHRLKGPEIAAFLVKLAEHRVTYREVAKNEISWPTVKSTAKNFDKDGYITYLTEFY